MTIPTISITQLQGLGESQTLEFKRSVALLKEACVALCAMVNAESANGVVVFGVDPSGEVSGLGNDNLDSTQRTIAQHCHQKFDPPLSLEIHPFACEGKNVLVMKATRQRSTPYHEYDGRAYVRVGSTSQQLSLDAKQRLQRSRDRNLHNGPWRCDTCGGFAGSISVVHMTDKGPVKAFTHGRCGGEWWPA
jgi:predicted HTH transcriptional regulator